MPRVRQKVYPYTLNHQLLQNLKAWRNVRMFQYFPWSHSVQAVILSSFFWGYVVLQVPAGELARRFGGKVLFTIAVFVNSILSLMLPLGAAWVNNSVK